MGIRKFTWPRKTFLLQIDCAVGPATLTSSARPIFRRFLNLSSVVFLHFRIKIKHGDNTLLPQTTVRALGVGIPVRLIVLPAIAARVSFH